MVTAQQTFKISFYPATVTVEAARGGGDEQLAISRADGAVSVGKRGAGAFAAAAQRTLSAHAIMGLIRLQRGPYLVLITGREAAGTIGASTVYRVTETRVVRVAADAAAPAYDAVDEATYLRLLENALATPTFLFSYDMDLTSSLQRQQAQAPGLAQYQAANDEFFFNKYLAEPLIAAADAAGVGGVFVQPVVHGFFASRQVRVRGTAFNYVLVTRRGRKRQGTRYFSRGADEDGNVSNYAETEQIVDFGSGGAQLAYVQVRGSIPAAWAQVANMHYVPELRVDVARSRDRFQRHVARMLDEYGDVVAVNLVNKVKYEKPMGDAFAALSAEVKSPHYHYVHFDFHRECSRMRWDRISLLERELEPLVAGFGYFRRGDGAELQLQRGVVRTNCMDCLDRTNVVQSELARTVLTQQLRDQRVFTAAETPADFPALRQMLNFVWADNADAVSCAYSGTGALKTDFTRTGKRTYVGALRDGRNSIERFVRGNFFDGERQDGIDLLLGTFRVRADARPFSTQLTRESRALVGTLYVCLFMLCYAVFYPRAGRWFGAANVGFVAAWLGVLALVFVAVRRAHTAELVNWPRLVAYSYRPPVLPANAALRLPLVDRWLPPPPDARPASKKQA
ncbi:Phosphoinositide phosphatase sac1 [Coemansia sp. RSA 2711]|nr:Phosphoinositide phosphatase sac1 [Coemansia sp. RSA 2711]KAJ2315707.1 Phosphoinositide phosphatase sac1 [Coemansia sp. RSA 2705]KAJ2322428.1 Phosphoinositide phosphatase sac1 [Coemansia sp. RSA 2704]KAJ2739975.1 Phosphoinositide phosphatase sac1 [Coemansia sp. Cherry 401B]